MHLPLSISASYARTAKWRNGGVRQNADKNCTKKGEKVTLPTPKLYTMPDEIRLRKGIHNSGEIKFRIPPPGDSNARSQVHQ